MEFIVSNLEGFLYVKRGVYILTIRLNIMNV